jgi:hypothetical protein
MRCRETHLLARAGHWPLMPVNAKLVVVAGLIVCLPVAAYFAGRLVGPAGRDARHGPATASATSSASASPSGPGRVPADHSDPADPGTGGTVAAPRSGSTGHAREQATRQAGPGHRSTPHPVRTHPVGVNASTTPVPSSSPTHAGPTPSSTSSPTGSGTPTPTQSPGADQTN